MQPSLDRLLPSPNSRFMSWLICRRQPVQRLSRSASRTLPLPIGNSWRARTDWPAAHRRRVAPETPVAIISTGPSSTSSPCSQCSKRAAPMSRWIQSIRHAHQRDHQRGRCQDCLDIGKLEDDIKAKVPVCINLQTWSGFRRGATAGLPRVHRPISLIVSTPPARRPAKGHRY